VTFVSENPGHNSASVYVPDGAEAWDGEIGKDITVTLSAEGVYIYKCTPHLALAMVGVIKVGNPGDISGAQAAADSLAATIAVNKERVAKYMGMAQ
ncbi:MAG: plastocyanin/azurin family copper-binding protein, partial [Pseudomonadota bacterium]